MSDAATAQNSEVVNGTAAPTAEAAPAQTNGEAVGGEKRKAEDEAPASDAKQ